MNRVCPECGKTSDWEIITRPEKFDIKDEKITVEMDLLQCPACGAEYEDLNSKVDPYNLAYEEYRRRKGMIHPAQILEFRKKYDLTQKELSGLLGFGDVTLSRYENGALQDEAHDQLLRFILDPANLYKLIKKKYELISAEKRKKLISQLKPEISIRYVLEELMGNNTPGIHNGNQAFDFNKLDNLLKFFTYRNPVFKSKLLKLFFYADFKAFKEYKKSITGLEYAHATFGPVPDQYEFILVAILEADSSISIDIQPPDNPIGEVIVSSEPCKPDSFTDSESEIIRNIYNRFRDMSAKQIEDFSHEEVGYKDTKQGEIISYAYAKELHI